MGIVTNAVDININMNVVVITVNSSNSNRSNNSADIMSISHIVLIDIKSNVNGMRSNDVGKCVCSSGNIVDGNRSTVNQDFADIVASIRSNGISSIVAVSISSSTERCNRSISSCGRNDVVMVDREVSIYIMICQNIGEGVSIISFLIIEYGIYNAINNYIINMITISSSNVISIVGSAVYNSRRNCTITISIGGHIVLINFEGSTDRVMINYVVESVSSTCDIINGNSCTVNQDLTDIVARSIWCDRVGKIITVSNH